MGKCVYCGKEVVDEAFFAKAHTREFAVCSDECIKGTEEYVKKDKKYKLTMFLMILVGGFGFMGNVIFGKGNVAMPFAYLGQMLAGLAFIIFPYPIVSFETFFSTSIKKTMLICRLIGIFFVVWGAVLLIKIM